MVNQALTTAWDALRTNVLNTLSTPDTPGAGAAFWSSFVGDTVTPYLEWDTATNRIFITADQKLFENTLSTPISVLFSERLYELFAGTPSRLGSYQGTRAYQIRFVDRYYDRTQTRVPKPLISNPKNEVIVSQLIAYQELTSIALWNPVASIVFASSLLPIISTQTSLPRDLGNPNSLVSGGNNSNFLPILSDFAIAVDASNQYRPSVEYNPGAEYRLIDMNSTTNLNRVDIIVFWKDRSGGLHPFELQPGCAASIKLMFRRKDFSVGS